MTRPSKAFSFFFLLLLLLPFLLQGYERNIYRLGFTSHLSRILKHILQTMALYFCVSYDVDVCVVESLSFSLSRFNQNFDKKNVFVKVDLKLRTMHF